MSLNNTTFYIDLEIAIDRAKLKLSSIYGHKVAFIIINYKRMNIYMNTYLFDNFSYPLYMFIHISIIYINVLRQNC